MPPWRVVPAWRSSVVGRRDVADRLQEPPVVEPVYPFQGRELDGLEAAPWPTPMDHLCLVKAVDGFSESIVIRISDAPDRGLHACFGQALGVFDRDVLGGFKWWSQHLDEGGCDEEAQAAFGSIWAGAIVVTRSTVGGGTR